jgi:hypothetical protein
MSRLKENCHVLEESVFHCLQSSAMKLDSASSFEMLVDIYIADYAASHVNNLCCENLASRAHLCLYFASACAVGDLSVLELVCIVQSLQLLRLTSMSCDCMAVI